MKAKIKKTVFTVATATVGDSDLKMGIATHGQKNEDVSSCLADKMKPAKQSCRKPHYRCGTQKI